MSMILIMMVTFCLCFCEYTFLEFYDSINLPRKTCYQQTLNYVLSHEHCQKLTTDLFQNHFALYFGFYWTRENLADINFWCFLLLLNCR